MEHRQPCQRVSVKIICGTPLTRFVPCRTVGAMNDQWQVRITDLEAAGWSLTRIGKRIGLSPAAVSDIKQGRTLEPKGMAAVELHRLHRRLKKGKS